MVEEMRKEIAQLIAESSALKERENALREQRRANQAKISDLSNKLNLLAKLGSLTDDDKKALHQILSAGAIESGEKMHTPAA